MKNHHPSLIALLIACITRFVASCAAKIGVHETLG